MTSDSKHSRTPPVGGMGGTSLADYGNRVYQRYHFTCAYCGYDGRTFDAWMQLSIDHVRPLKSGGSNDDDNLVPACRACNSITSRMTFPAELSKEEIVRLKRERVARRRKEFYEFWAASVAPRYLDRPLPEIDGG